MYSFQARKYVCDGERCRYVGHPLGKEGGLGLGVGM
jgi:hypothetical protein